MACKLGDESTSLLILLRLAIGIYLVYSLKYSEYDFSISSSFSTVHSKSNIQIHSYSDNFLSSVDLDEWVKMQLDICEMKNVAEV